MNVDNKRTLERFNLQVPATIEIPREGPEENTVETLDLITSDVSAGGAYFETSAPVAVGTPVKVDLILSIERLKQMTGKQAHIKVTGKVVRTLDGGMAVQFDPDFDIRSL